MNVLVVEDERKMVRILSQGLTEEGWTVDVAGNGEEAVRRALDHAYDCVILDVNLPGFDGYEVCRRIRAGNGRMPILMLTARDAVSERVAGLDAGADDYLVKPFAFEELVARLRALVRRPSAVRPTVLRAGGLELDAATRTVTRHGAPVELTAKEFALLEYLMHHPGEVLSRTRILEHVWDVNYSGLSNVVDVYVRYLRQKLGDPGAIESVRGVGYVLRDHVAA